MGARLKEQYLKETVPALTKQFSYTNRMAVPKIEKISLNVGMGEATQNSKLMDGAVAELTAIAGQKPIVTKARKSIAAFKLRELSERDQLIRRGTRVLDLGAGGGYSTELMARAVGPQGRVWAQNDRVDAAGPRHCRQRLVLPRTGRSAFLEAVQPPDRRPAPRPMASMSGR